ncbi:hypothetical protein Hanom_Chr07g00662781 [Helianthus anomalus]
MSSSQRVFLQLQRFQIIDGSHHHQPSPNFEEPEHAGTFCRFFLYDLRSMVATTTKTKDKAGNAYTISRLKMLMKSYYRA